MRDKLFVLSMDAMVGDDIGYLFTKPNFSRLMEHCCRVEKAQSIYPSITYPAHVSMITGCRAAKHGIFNNTTFRTTTGYPAWHLYSSEVKVEDLFAAAKRAGCTTAAVYWPVCGLNPNIDYLINEYFFYDPKESQTPQDILDRFTWQGADAATLEAIKENMDRFPNNYRDRVGKLTLDQTFDDFIIGCVCSLIRNHQPDVLVAHNCLLDSLRHKYGVFHEYVTEGLDITDVWLGQIIDSMEAAGVLDRTNFVIVSDHGQMNFARRIKPNVILARNGFIELATDGSIASWRAYAQANGMSASVFVKDKQDEQAVYDCLDKHLRDGVWGFDKIYTTAQVLEAYGWSGDFSFVLETDGITTFSEDWHEPIVNPVDLTDYRLGKATHGYEPQKGPQPVFVASGPAFKQDMVIPFCHIFDEAPTFARILGQSMPQAEGRVLSELLV
jgi:predicted AlkP superfamily pyrophosphatase or phosphodiesterase